MKRLLFGIVLLGARAVPAQRDHALDSLASLSSGLVARYADRRVAAREGYRRIGADFPGMGEHWLNPSQLLSGRIDAAKPTLLMYATIAGQPRLLGVGFVVTTQRGELATATPGWPSAWHEHSGLLADESGVAPGGAGASDTHVWVLHVWTAMHNPDGMFSPDNWNLPFTRAGLAPATEPHADAARALSLVHEGDRYLTDVLTDASLRVAANAARIDSAIAATRTAVSTIALRGQGTGTLSAVDIAALRTGWASLGADLRAVMGPAVDRYLVAQHAAHHEHEESP